MSPLLASSRPRTRPSTVRRSSEPLDPGIGQVGNGASTFCAIRRLSARRRGVARRTGRRCGPRRDARRAAWRFSLSLSRPQRRTHPDPVERVAFAAAVVVDGLLHASAGPPRRRQVPSRLSPIQLDRPTEARSVHQPDGAATVAANDDTATAARQHGCRFDHDPQDPPTLAIVLRPGDDVNTIEPDQTVATITGGRVRTAALTRTRHARTPSRPSGRLLARYRAAHNTYPPLQVRRAWPAFTIGGRNRGLAGPPAWCLARPLAITPRWMPSRTPSTVPMVGG